MPTYNLKCKSCDYSDPNKKFPSYKDYEVFKCPDCGGDITQVYESVNFAIKGYCYNNEYKGKTMYRDYVNYATGQKKDKKKKKSKKK